MNQNPGQRESTDRRARRAAGLSYKFQRLRERLRAAIEQGELAGKLPGERLLAKRFGANAKTLSKAMTDLVSEGVLERSIGRGTFVKGSDPATTDDGKWLILTDADQPPSDTIQLLLRAHPGSRLVAGAAALRPSLINQFSAVVNFSLRTSEAVLRDLAVRGVPVVTVGHEPRPYATHAVLIDRGLGAAGLGRDLMLGGHRRVACVRAWESDDLLSALRMVASRYGSDALVESADVRDVAALIEDGVTAIVCDCAQQAQRVLRQLEKAGLSAPRSVCLAVVGPSDGQYPCTGYYVDPEQEAQAVEQLLDDTSGRRPTSLWLIGSFVERGTVVPADALRPAAGMALAPSAALTM